MNKILTNNTNFFFFGHYYKSKKLECPEKYFKKIKEKEQMIRQHDDDKENFNDEHDNNIDLDRVDQAI